MEERTREAERLLKETLSLDLCIIEAAAAELEKLSARSGFSRCLLTVISGGENQLVRESAAIYFKNYVLRRFHKCSFAMEIDRDFLKEFMELLFVADRRVFKFLLEAFGKFFMNDYIRKRGWRDLFPQLESVIQNSSLMGPNANSQWNTVHALEVLAVICKTLMSQNSRSRRLAVETPFRSATEDLFYNNFPPIQDDGSPELELMAKTILVPLLARNQEFIDKAFADKDKVETEFLQCIRVICKCMSCIVKFFLPSAICSNLPKYCCQLCRVLDSFEFENPTFEVHYLILLKITRRGLDFLCSLVNQKRNLIESCVPNIEVSAENIASQHVDIAMLDPLRMRILNLAFDLLGYLKKVSSAKRLRICEPQDKNLVCKKPRFGRKITLAEDVLHVILSHVPVKSLIRFKSACKDWLALISSPEFTNFYYTVSQKRPSLLTLGMFDGDGLKLHLSTFRTSDLAPRNTFSVEVPYYFRHPSIDAIHVLSSGGVLCITSDLFVGFMFLVQPSTQEIVSLPSIDQSIVPANHCEECLGFGYDTLTKVHKVFRFFSFRRHSLCMVFSVGLSQSWSRARASPPYRIACGSAPFLNGAVHLLPAATFKDGYIAAFSVELESYKRISLPIKFQTQLQDDCSLTLTVLRGDLGLLSQMKTWGSIVKLWTLRGYEGGDWVLLYNIDLTPLNDYPLMVEYPPWVRPVAVVGDDGDLVISISGTSLLKYDPKARVLKWKIGNGFPSTFFIESLFPLHHR